MSQRLWTPSHIFWLFSFERYNGLLGNQPNNNHAIELQLLNRFNNDNLRLDLVRHSESMPFADLFRETTVVYASNFNSIKPTQLLPDSHENATFTEPPKHSLFVLTESLLTNLRSMYANLLQDYATQIENGTIELQSSCRKYSHVFMNGKKLASSEQEVPYVLAIPPLESSDQSVPLKTCDQTDWVVQVLALARNSGFPGMCWRCVKSVEILNHQTLSTSSFVACSVIFVIINVPILSF